MHNKGKPPIKWVNHLVQNNNYIYNQLCNCNHNYLGIFLISAQQNTGGQMSSMKEKKDIGKRIVLLENRLDGVMINFNATLAHNR